MTFAHLIDKVKRLWWLVLASTIAFSLIFFPWLSESQYQASIGFGLNLNSLQSSTRDGNTDLAYVTSLEAFSLYLQNRFSSIEIQELISRNMGAGVSSFSDKKPFYDVSNQGGGFISLGYTSQDETLAKKFLSVSKEAYNQLVQEWNEQRAGGFEIKPMTKFIETVTPVSRSKQMQVLPTIAGLLLGIFIALILPISKPADKSELKPINT
jgi:hypothetical protein